MSIRIRTTSKERYYAPDTARGIPPPPEASGGASSAVPEKNTYEESDNEKGTVDWARREGKLPGKVLANRVIKCF